MTEWIKCSDKLPTPYLDVLVTDGEKCWVATLIGDFQYFLASHPDYKRNPNNEYGVPYLTLSVPTHWMPLPEEPKDG